MATTTRMGLLMGPTKSRGARRRQLSVAIRAVTTRGGRTFAKEPHVAAGLCPNPLLLFSQHLGSQAFYSHAVGEAVDRAPAGDHQRDERLRCCLTRGCPCGSAER